MQNGLYRPCKWRQQAPLNVLPIYQLARRHRPYDMSRMCCLVGTYKQAHILTLLRRWLLVLQLCNFEWTRAEIWKVKVTLWYIYADTEGRRKYNSNPFASRRWNEVGGQHHAAPVFTLANTQYPLYRRLGGSQGRSGRGQKISSLSGFDPRTVRRVASSYTDWAVRLREVTSCA